MIPLASTELRVTSFFTSRYPPVRNRVFHWSLLVPCTGIVMFIFLARDCYKRRQGNMRLLSVSTVFLVQY